MSIWMGIDPGLGGAIATYDSVKHTLTVLNMPTKWATVNNKQRRQLDKYTLHILLRDKYVNGAILESVHAMPDQGVTSSFSFGSVFGATEQALICNGILYTLVSPQKWKKFFGLSADKDEARALAAKEFPEYANMFRRKTDDGRAEAALMARYGFLGAP